MPKKDKRVDAFINNSADFAQPILIHLRAIVHKACPDVEETIKWGMPTFMYSGSIMCGIAAHKNHCSFTFWRGSAMKDPHQIMLPIGGSSGMGQFGKLTDMSDLPDEKILAEYIAEAMKLNEAGVKAMPKARTKADPKKLVTPDDLLDELKANPLAEETFNNFSPSHKREYVEWLTDAKTEATRTKRLKQAIIWMSEGKPRNWKYMKKYQ